MKTEPCVSREMADRLKEAGYPSKDNGFFYALAPGYDTGSEEFRYFESKPQEQFDPVYAPTATELLPKAWHTKRYAHVRADGTKIVACIVINERTGMFVLNENPHDAAAMAWLWEKENGQ
jgi:hypothetical protein